MVSRKTGQDRHCNESGLRKVSAFGFDQDETGVLETLRILCSGHCGMVKDGQVAAFDVAEAWFGLENGIAIAVAVQNLLQSLRLSRMSSFQFSNPACPVCRERVTPHEQTLMRLIISCARADAAGARSAALVLCEGGNAAPLLAAAMALAAVMEDERKQAGQRRRLH